MTSKSETEPFWEVRRSRNRPSAFRDIFAPKKDALLAQFAKQYTTETKPAVTRKHRFEFVSTHVSYLVACHKAERTSS